MSLNKEINPNNIYIYGDMRQFAFHIGLNFLGNVCTQLYSIQLWVNSRPDLALKTWYKYI